MKGSTTSRSHSFRISSQSAFSPLPISPTHPVLRLPPSAKSPSNKPLSRSSHPAARTAGQRICSRYSPRREKSQFLEGQKIIFLYMALRKRVASNCRASLILIHSQPQDIMSAVNSQMLWTARWHVAILWLRFL
ncbi:hypothetical protein SISSUDRAFT_1132931 [Sistotremastrum suecicum HHB10207 ss-3]|uniref:Uncharacterized protein n=1 Tax=Sistotremastrum suecicum HHB10207 ss-3 TaxID=1314776 RepID=A0A165Y2N0_9AGAM|nr:hypothetical protein SISSUDRAFT_1132931 [Sistotremastrum suecicum HHB10207 ss-3]